MITYSLLKETVQKGKLVHGRVTVNEYLDKLLDQKKTLECIALLLDAEIIKSEIKDRISEHRFILVKRDLTLEECYYLKMIDDDIIISRLTNKN